MPVAQRKTSSLDKLLAAFVTAPVKSSVLSLLVVLLVALWVGLLGNGHSPGSARGAAVLIQPSRISAIPNGSESRWSGVGSDSLLKWVQEKIVPLQRNCFAVPLDDYPRDGTPTAEAAGNQDGFWDHVAKSMSSRADQQEQRQILIDNVRIAAGSLKLQSTIMGSRPSAMVNGEMVQQGSVVAGFRVLRIEAHRMIVEREGIRLAILMQ